MPNLELGVIGNCQIAALIDERANIVWACMPQFDSDPVFCQLLREGGGNVIFDDGIPCDY